MINVGLDFGSTNSLVSVYKDGRVDSKNLFMGSPYVPSVVSFNKKRKKYQFGYSAKNSAGLRDITVYRAFKMLLREKEENLKQWQYDNENSPRAIAEQFIRYMLEAVCTSEGDHHIGKLTVGIPEFWRNDDKADVDGSAVIREICQNLDFVDEVQIVTEPEAASAYFAYEYLRRHHKNFSGHILLIDYGGGTLDLTLSEVKTQSESNSQYNMHIRTEKHTGAGDSHEGKIGQAALVYQEAVIMEAMRREGILEPGQKITDINFDYGEYCQLLNSLETQLLNNVADINEVFNDYLAGGIWYSVDDLEEEEFAWVSGKSTGLTITYGLLVKVYLEEIKDILDAEIDKMIEYMDEHGIDWRHGNNDTFQLALVGGFGNFYLVDYQVKQKFNSIAVGHEVIAGSERREQAIALGAALYASNVIGLKYAAPSSMGIWSVDANKEPVFQYAFEQYDELEMDVPHFVKNSIGTEAIFCSADGIFRDILLVDGSDQQGRKYSLSDTEIKDIPVSDNKYFQVAFSVDAKEIFTMWIWDYDRKEKIRTSKYRKVRLNSLHRIRKNKQG